MTVKLRQGRRPLGQCGGARVRLAYLGKAGRAIATYMHEFEAQMLEHPLRSRQCKDAARSHPGGDGRAVTRHNVQAVG